MTRTTRVRETPLRNLRRARTINQEQLAKLVGISQETISRAERGLVPLSVDVQARLAAIFGVSRQELFPESEAVAR